MSISNNSTNLVLDTKRHSFAHLMAAAVGKMFPEASRDEATEGSSPATTLVQFGVGPVIENGCYYDFVLPRTLIPEDLVLLEGHLKEMLKAHLSFKVQEMDIDEAIAYFNNANQPLKVELLMDLKTKGTTSMSEEEKADFGGLSLDEKVLPREVAPQVTEGVLEAYLSSISSHYEKLGILPYNQNIQANATELRNQASPMEVRFWSELENDELLKQIKVKRQKPVLNYILDFYLPQFGLVVELDGSSHNENQGYDQNRTEDLEKLGIKVIRFTNEEIKENLNSVFEKVKSELLLLIPTPSKNNDASLLGKTPSVSFAATSQGRTLPKITLYRIVNESTGEILFEDLCKGPHITHVKEIKNIGFKLDKFSSSYWRGDQARGINMQRLYALVYETKEELATYIEQRDEAKKRDHRVLGEQHKLFSISNLVGSGLVLFQPKGAIIRNLLQQYLWQIHKNKGYQQVWTPHLAKEDLYIQSGHAGHYMEDMFSVYGGTSKEKFYVKPMNCPHHMQIFDDNQFSYRDMPVRYFEPATVYRDEKTGQLSGLARVRSITQDDGHIFCRVNQIEEEVSVFVSAVKEFYGTMGMAADWVSLSVRDPMNPTKYLGTDENWAKAESALENAAKANNLNYRRMEGEAAFYGPKLDFMFKDCIGRQWQLSTVQCDFNLPERFDLSFTNEESEKERPVVIHRAIAGSYERFFGVLIEHFAGKFPFWLAPEQIRILTLNDAVLPFVDKVKAELDEVVLMKPLKYNELRYTVDTRMETLGKKIRDAKLELIPMLIVIGPKDVEAGEVSVEYAGKSFKVKVGSLEEILEVVG